MISEKAIRRIRPPLRRHVCHILPTSGPDGLPVCQHGLRMRVPTAVVAGDTAGLSGRFRIKAAVAVADALLIPAFAVPFARKRSYLTSCSSISNSSDGGERL